MFIEAQGIYIDSELFKDNAEYMGDAMERGRQIEEDAAKRIEKAGYSASYEQIRKVIFWDRKDKMFHNEAEIREFLMK